MSLNLIRDARVFFTLNVDPTTGEVQGTVADPFTSGDTFEIQVLDGFTFSQNSTTETVTVTEAGTTPVRGQRVFNVALEPVNFSFSTYVRPSKVSTASTAEEKWLWNAFASKNAADGLGTGTSAPGWKDGVAGTSPAAVSFAGSNSNQLQKFGLILVMPNSTFVIHNCCLDSATIDFALDGIATIAWTGMATKLEQLANKLTATNGTGADEGKVLFTGGATGTDVLGQALLKLTAGKYLANKLSTAQVVYNGQTYTVPITGGSLAINNNTTFLTPATVGVVNQVLTHFTGARTYTGSLTAYLRRTAATLETGDLIDALQTSGFTTANNSAAITISIGGSSATTKVVLNAPTALLQIPQVSTEQVVGVTFNFTPLASNSAIENTDELTISYYHPV